ncbi:FxsA family membrane protein [Streptomyces sp. NPDC002889]|uniref:FxsA family membrane protein n=1 Tax=Streptomyces sp. NPDC002889 TaxID=3364669 RepID=UPI0036931764
MTTGAPNPTAPRRSRARTFVPLGIAAWLVLEIWLLTVAAGAVGALTVLALLIGSGVLGAFVIKRAGRRAFSSLTETLQQQTGQAPPSGAAGPRSSGNGLLMLAGLLLMLPGFVSDAAGLLLLLPPVRARLARYTERSLERRMSAAVPGGFGDVFQQARIHRPDGKIVQGEVIRNDREPAPRRHEDQGPPPPLNR